MTLRPNYLRAIGVTYFFVAVFAAVVFAGARLQGLSENLGPLIGLVLLGGTFLTIGVCVMFVPRELRYDAKGFSCRMIVQGTRAFGWDQLVAYGRGNNVFLLKFEGCPALQISGYGFASKDWKEFKEFLGRSFPEKKCSIWIGPMPVIRKR